MGSRVERFEQIRRDRDQEGTSRRGRWRHRCRAGQAQSLWVVLRRRLGVDWGDARVAMAGPRRGSTCFTCGRVIRVRRSRWRSRTALGKRSLRLTCTRLTGSAGCLAWCAMTISRARPNKCCAAADRSRRPVHRVTLALSYPRLTTAQKPRRRLPIPLASATQAAAVRGVNSQLVDSSGPDQRGEGAKNPGVRSKTGPTLLRAQVAVEVEKRVLAH